jgi:hypothetical protein
MSAPSVLVAILVEHLGGEREMGEGRATWWSFPKKQHGGGGMGRRLLTLPRVEGIRGTEHHEPAVASFMEDGGDDVHSAVLLLPGQRWRKRKEEAPLVTPRAPPAERSWRHVVLLLLSPGRRQAKGDREVR